MPRYTALPVYLGIYLINVSLIVLARSHPIEESKNITKNYFSSNSELLEINTTPTKQFNNYERSKKNQKTEKNVIEKSESDLNQGVVGTAEVDYPIYSVIPKTSFSCKGLPPGYYADNETRCQVFHICYSTNSMTKQSFLCPNGTVFSQELKTCEWWTKVDCDESKQYYYKDKTEDDLQVSPSETREIITLPSTLELPLNNTNLSNSKNKTFNENKGNFTIENVKESVDANTTNHKEEDIQLILDNLFADFEDNKGTKPVKYTEEYLREKLHNTNLSIHYENQKNLQYSNKTFDYSFLLYDHLNKKNRTPTIPVDSINLKSDKKNDSDIELIEEFFKHLNINVNLKNTTNNSEELTRTLQSQNVNNLNTTPVSNYDDEDEYGINESKETSEEFVINTEETIFDKDANMAGQKKTATNNKLQPSLLKSNTNGNNNKDDEFLISQLLAEFHISNDTDIKGGNKSNLLNNELKTNSKTNLNQNLRKQTSRKPEDHTLKMKPATSIETYQEQLFNIDDLNLTEIQSRKLQNFIQDHAYNSLFNNNNKSLNTFLDLLNLKELENKKVKNNSASIIFKSDEREIQITPRPTNNQNINIPLSKYLLGSHELLKINKGFSTNNPLQTTQNVYIKYLPVDTSLKRPDTASNINYRNNLNYNNNYQYKPALSLLDIYNINKLQALNDYNDSVGQAQTQQDSVQPSIYETESQLKYEEHQLSTPETVIFPSVGFSFDSEEEVKAFNEAVSAGLIDRL